MTRTTLETPLHHTLTLGLTLLGLRTLVWARRRRRQLEGPTVDALPRDVDRWVNEGGGASW